jgi:predicted RNase H-like nuclease (RuvC/YqgF family)
MAEAESREREASNTISKLEETNSKLEAENLNTRDENERLIEALERLTSDMVLSELRVKELQQDLDATHVCHP